MKLTIKKPGLQLPKKHPTVNRGDRRFDQSQLRESGYASQVHRDYAAHFFRWGFAKNFIKKGVRVLEVGCGQDMPLVKVLAPSMGNIPERYVGCDMNAVKPPFNAKWMRTLDQFDFTTRYAEAMTANDEKQFDVVVCFEVIEHMPKEDGYRLMAAIESCLHQDGVALISTPVYNERHMAANHIHEYRFDELKKLFEDCHFLVDRVHGTFMTSQAIKRVATPEELALVEELHKFYSWDVIANFLAPKYPEASSNCCWVLKRQP
jgi:2-polyprenyl-3-methyl-5-hydroxy-6-metoxy-1,4-benzoquinol methylase